MNNKKLNPFFKQIISEIAVNANKGRLNLSWEIIEEAKRKKKKVKEADENKPAEPAADAGEGQPPTGGSNEAPQDAQTPEQQPAPAAGESPAGAQADASAEAGGEAGAGGEAEAGGDAGAGGDAEAGGDAGAGGEEDPDQAKEDAVKAKAELEKAKAEKAQAEKELKDQSYLKLSSPAGTEFLMGKLLDQAFKGNSIDALAGELVDKLKIDTPDDVNNFTNDVATYMAMPGMSDLLSSMRTLASNRSEKSEEPTA